jgi:peroxiredoxin Q/BCP
MYSFGTMKSYLLAALSIFSFLSSCSAQSKHIAIGDTPAPFTLTDQNGRSIHSSDYLGKKTLVIYFYPKDESPVCTREACAFRDSYADFERAGAMVVGINSAPVATHRQFAENHGLPFILLSDPGNKVLHQFGVKSKMIVSGRETFVIGKDGKVAFIYNSFSDGPKHVSETLRFLQEQNRID